MTSMNFAWLKLVLTVLLAVVLTGCTVQPIAPAPSFSVPVVRGPVVILPRLALPAPLAPAGLAPLTLRGTIVIDPGHGGKDPGAQIPGVNEKTINLAVSRAIAKKLSLRGVTVILTRNSDIAVELADRPASGARADLFVSIHSDSNPSSAKVGHSVLLPRSGNPRARLAGQYIDRRMIAAGSPTYTMRTDTRNLLVLREARCPAVLVELGYLTNRTEASRLVTAAYQEQLAIAIANGIIDYLVNKR